MKKHAQNSDQSIPLRTLLRPPGRADVLPLKQSSEIVRRAESEMQARLGVSLPKSYSDFLQAYQPTAFPALVPGTEIHARGFLPPERVDYLQKLRPDIVEMEEKFPTSVEDARYFVYGTKQDDVAVRTEYYRGALLVGVYSQHELILLNPAVRTQDGEMEAILLLHSSAFRAPSFGELVRQLSVLETTAPGRMPPYAQAKLVGTCAEQLPLTSVWWD